MIKLRSLVIALFFFMCTTNVLGMVYDNRFLPLLRRTFSRTCSLRNSPCGPCLKQTSGLFGDLFIMTANEAFAKGEDNPEIGLFEVFGDYNLGAMEAAINLLGLPDPLNTPALMRFQGQDVIFRMNGKIASEGFALQYDQHIWRYFSGGFSCFFMHLFSKNDFFLSPKTITDFMITPDEQIRLDQARRFMNQEVGLLAPTFSRAGFSDIDLYLRMGNIWDYLYKLKRIDAGISIGALIPSGLTREILNPASIPFGGDGFWGVYVAGDVEIELKEDWIVGLYVRFNQRFERTKQERLPIANEQQLYAATQGSVRIDPGFTSVVAPYAILSGIRDGLGVQAQYTLIFHENDVWKQVNKPPSLPPATLSQVIKRSRWNAEYFTVNVYYDFSKVRDPYDYPPIFSFKWDIPTKLLIAKRASKTNRVALGLELLY